LRPLHHLWLFVFICYCNWAMYVYCVALQYFSHNLQALDSDESDNASNDKSASAPLFLCCWQGKHDSHTHASAHHLLYNLGKNAFVGENKNNLSLDIHSAARWLSYTESKVRKVMTIKVRGSKMVKA
jgi:hypothetical protein